MYHYFVNNGSTVLKKNADYHDDILTVLKMRIDEYRERNVLELYRDEIELDVLISGFLAALESHVLRYDKPPYGMYESICDYINAEFPNACQNVYINKYIPEKYRILLPLLNAKVSEDELNKIADSFKTNY